MCVCVFLSKIVCLLVHINPSAVACNVVAKILGIQSGVSDVCSCKHVVSQIKPETISV